MRPLSFIACQKVLGICASTKETLLLTRLGELEFKATETISSNKKENCTQTSAGLTLKSSHKALN